MNSTRFHEEDETEKIEDHPDQQQEDDDPFRVATPEDDPDEKFGNDLNNERSGESGEDNVVEVKPAKRKWSDVVRNLFGRRAKQNGFSRQPEKRHSRPHKRGLAREGDDEEDEDAKHQKRLKKIQKWKNSAQGLMDIALITSNLNQLKNLLKKDSPQPFFGICLSAIIISLVLQILIMIVLAFRFNTAEDRENSAKVSNYDIAITIGSGLIIIANLVVINFDS